MKFNIVILISLATFAATQTCNNVIENQGEVLVKKELDSISFESRGLGLKDFFSDHMPWSGKKHWKDDEGKEHWKEDGKEHWKDNEGKDCWNDKDGKKHWKDHEGKEHWKDNEGKQHSYRPPIAMKRSYFEI